MGYFLFILLVASLFAIRDNQKLNVRTSFILIILLVLLNGLRGLDVGRDTMNYFSMYSAKGASERIEPLFSLLITALKSVGASFNFFLCVTAILTYMPLYGFIKKWSINPCLSLVVYLSFSVFFFQNSFNVIRNAISASFLLWSIGYITESKYKKAIIPGLIAIGFHYSSLIAIPFLLLAKITKETKSIIAIPILIASIIIGLSSAFYENALTAILQQVSFASGAAADNYLDYLSDIDEIEVNTNGIIMLIAPLSLITLLSFLTKRIDNTLRMVLFYGTILGNLFVSVLYTYRLTLFMTLVSLVIIPQLCANQNKGIKTVTIIAVAAMAIYFTLSVINGNATNIVPYSFFFEK